MAVIVESYERYVIVSIHTKAYLYEVINVSISTTSLTNATYRAHNDVKTKSFTHRDLPTNHT